LSASTIDMEEHDISTNDCRGFYSLCLYRRVRRR
jgi:hypothetical protein